MRSRTLQRFLRRLPVRPRQGSLTRRFGFWVLIALAVIVLFISEATYRQTTSILHSGRALSDSRTESLKLLQLMTHIENAELGFIATAQPRYLQQFRDLEKAVPEASREVLAFFRQRDEEGIAIAAQVEALIQAYLDNAGRAVQMAEQEDFLAAAQLAGSDSNRMLNATLRDTLIDQFLQASAVAQERRDATDRALLGQRIALGAITCFTALLVYLLLQHLRRQDRRRDKLQADLVAERAHLEAEVRQRTSRLLELAGHLQTVGEHERAHLARELHDELGGILTVCKLEIARARSRAAQPEEVLKRLDSVTLHLNSGIALKRRIIEDLRPSALTHLGLQVALENLCKDMSSGLGLPVNLSIVPLRLSADEELSVYRFIQEALTNAGKYAEATAIDVSLDVAGGRVGVTVTDNGVGFDINLPRTGHHGLAGMQFRAESLGGSLGVRSAPGQGTTLRMEFPEEPLGPLGPQSLAA